MPTYEVGKCASAASFIIFPIERRFIVHWLHAELKTYAFEMMSAAHLRFIINARNEQSHT